MTKRKELIDLIYAALFAALIVVLGFIAVPLPFSPVPVTGQTLAIMLAGSILTVRQAAMSVGTFLLLGAVGIPVFAGGAGGLGVLAGPRGGYLVGFLIGAIVIALINNRSSNILKIGAANIIGGIVVIYLIGVLWLNQVTGMGLEKAVVAGMMPFIPGDLFKVAIATVVAVAVNKQMLRLRTEA